MDEIASATRVTKRTLYQHFESKDALLAAVLKENHELSIMAFKTFSDRMTGTASQMINSLFEGLIDWADTPLFAGSGFTRLAIELADLPGHPARSIARQHKAALEQYLAELLAKANVKSPHDRAREISLLAEGATAMILIHGDRNYADAAAAAAKRLLHERGRRRVNRL